MGFGSVFKKYNPLAIGANVVGGLLGVQSGIDTPELQHAELDPATSQVLDKRVAEASQPHEQFANQLVGEQMGNMDLAKNMVSAGRGPGIMDGATSEAIKRRQQRQMGSQQNEMERSIRANSMATQAGRQAATLGAVNKNAAQALSFAKKAALADQNRKYARNNAINQIVRGTSTVAGAALGGAYGGAEGARAGAALGQGIGGSVGPQGGNLSYLGG